MRGPWPDGPGVVTFPDRSRVRGRALRRSPTRAADAADWTLYLLSRQPNPGGAPGASAWIAWRDFWLPRDRTHADHLLREAYSRARAGERVDITCTGGVGRTGTAIACIAQLAGVCPQNAVYWTREAYHRRAVETPWQRQHVERFLTQANPGR